MLRSAITAVLLVGVLLGSLQRPAVAALGDADIVNHYENAVRLFGDGDYAAAVVELRNVLQADPDHLPARLLIGRSFLRLGDARSAEGALQRARTLGIDDDHVLGPLALAYLMQGKYEELLAEIPTGGRSTASRADVLVARGMALLELQQWREAEQSFVEAAELLPDDPASIIGRVRVMLAQGRRDEAEALVDARRGVLVDGGVEAWYWYVKGDARRLSGDPERAVEHYSRALQVNPDHLAALVGRSAARIDAGDDRGALADLERAYDLMPDEPQVAYLYALMQAEAGDVSGSRAALASASAALANIPLDEMREHPPTLLMAGIVTYNQGLLNQSEAYVSRYVAMRPHHVAARELLGRIRLILDDPGGAVAVLEPARAMAPDDVELLELLGDAYLRTERYREAGRAFEAALPSTTREAAVRTGLAMSLRALGRDNAAGAELRAALAADPLATEAAVLLAVMYLERRLYEPALDVALGLAEVDPDSPVAHNLAGGALFGLGREDEARTRFEQALAVDPDFFPAQTNLARLDAAQGMPDRAAERYREILADDPTEVRAILALSRLAEEQGDLATAIDWLERYLGQVPDAPGHEVDLVGLYLAAGRTERALSLAYALRLRDPERFGFREAEVRALMAVGRSRDAVQALRSMSDHIATTAGEFSRTAVLQLDLNDTTGARISLDRAYNRDPRHVPSRVTLARLEMDSGNEERALEIARELQRIDPTSAVGDLLVGDILMTRGAYAEAAEAYASAMEKAPNTELAWRLYRARRHAGDAERALADLEAWSAAHPGDYAARRAVAVAYLQAGRHEDATAAHEALLAAQPNDLVLLNNLALLYHRAGDPRAMDYARRAYELAPLEPAAIDTLGWILVQDGEVERGLALLREAYVRGGDNPQVRYHIAVALNRLGRTEAARAELQAALTAGREFDGIDQARRLMEQLSGS